MSLTGIILILVLLLAVVLALLSLITVNKQKILPWRNPVKAALLFFLLGQMMLILYVVPYSTPAFWLILYTLCLGIFIGSVPDKK